MSEFSRRSLLLAGMAATAATAAPALSAEMQKLHVGGREGGGSLFAALKHRRSTRLYSDEAIAPEMLSDLLWAAYGINRPGSGGRTVPSWHSSYGTDLYVADAGGVWLYDPKEETLTKVLDVDLRKKASPQPFVGTAPVVLIHVANLDRMYEAPEEEQTRFAYVDSAIIGQNIYLFCASVGLGTCLVGGADAAGLKEAMQLPAGQLVTFVQPVGHPQPG